MLPTRALGLARSLEINQRPGKKFRQSFTGTPATHRGSENKRGVSLLAALRQGAGSSRGRRVTVCPRVGLKGRLRWSVHPFGGVCSFHLFSLNKTEIFLKQHDLARDSQP